MIQVEISASKRNEFGKGPMRRLRQSGKTPLVLYGTGVDTLSLTVETKIMVKELLAIQRRNAVLTVNVEDGENYNVLIREIQVDPVDDTLLHLDFQTIDLDQAGEFTVPVSFKGTSRGVELGGFLHIVSGSVQLKGKPLDIPDAVEVEVTEMITGDSIPCEAIQLPESVTMITPGDKICVEVTVMSAAPVESEEPEELAVTAVTAVTAETE